MYLILAYFLHVVVPQADLCHEKKAFLALALVLDLIQSRCTRCYQKTCVQPWRHFTRL